MILEKFVDELPIPEVIKPINEVKGHPYYEIIMKEVFQRLHRDLPLTKIWGYEGTYPGPTFEVEKNTPIYIKWINDLPVNHHLLPVDRTIHGAEYPNPKVRTVVHLHGGHVSHGSDGSPEAWFTYNYSKVGPDFNKKVYYYPNNQPAASLWYHDQAIGITRLNVYAGLVGCYIIRDEEEKALGLPKGSFEIPLLIQDKTINKDGSLYYPSKPYPAVPDVFPSIVSDFFGETILVNGKIWPYLDVQPRLYRFRITNGSNARFYNLSFLTASGKSPDWFQIGTDGGLLENPKHLMELLLSPGERADVLVDFSDFKNQDLILINNATTPFPMGDDPDPDTTGQIIKFKVGSVVCDWRNNRVPVKLVEVERLDPDCATITRNLTLSETTDEFGRLKFLLTNQVWDDPITEAPLINSTEIWNLINLTINTHPIHLHLAQFQILDRRPFDVQDYNDTGEIRYTGPAQIPDSNERGLKDTVRVSPRSVTRIIAKFTDFPGVFPWHCHILEHEDHEMIRPYKVKKELCDNTVE